MLFLLLLLPSALSHTGPLHTKRKHYETYFLHRYAELKGFTDADNALLETCILRLELIPANCQIYMSQLMLKFIPIMFVDNNNFSLTEILTWALDRYPELMGMCDDNCYNNTIAYSYQECTSQLPVSNFFPGMSNTVFSDLLLDFATLMCHTNPGGDSCLKYEAQLVTGQLTLNETVLDRCFEQDSANNTTVLPATCKPGCKLFLEERIEEYGCCLTSWRAIEKYSAHLSSIIHLYPDKLFELLDYCQVAAPAQCPYTPDLTKLSIGMVTFLGIAGLCAVVAIGLGVIRNYDP